MNCNADKMAQKFRKLMDDGDVRPLREGFFMDSMEVGITANGMRVTSHIPHQIRMHIQGSKHCNYLQDKHEWDNATCKYLQDKHEWDNGTWDSINWKGLKLLMVPFSWSIETYQDVKEHAWMAQHRMTEVKDLSGCH
jgi:hypothetical protein